MPLTELLQNKKINLVQVINLAILVVAALIAINIFKGQNKKITLIREISNEQRNKNEILLRVGDLKKWIEQYKEGFRPQDPREVINTITNLVAASGAKVISIKPLERLLGRRMVSEVYSKIFFDLSIQVKGYHQLGEFISRLENNPRTFIIESLQLKQGLIAESEAEPGAGRLQAKLFISEVLFK